MKILIVYNLPSDKNSTDDLDVLTQVEAVRKVLIKLGHMIDEYGVDLNLTLFQEKIDEFNPDIVFNLVEALNGTEAYMHFVPQILEKMNIPFTGGSSESLFITTNKVFTKKMFNNYKIQTPKWITPNNIFENNGLTSPCIIKPISVDASVGLDDSLIIYDLQNLKEELQRRTEKYGECFVEEFIDGREFNISIIDTEKGVKVLPIAEIRFEDYPEGKAKIVNYDAKWEENSFEYSHTVRHFDFEDCDKILLKELENVTLKCWKNFNLRGYARVDFRVDKNNNIYVLEINSNPGIAPDSGFFAASHQYGWDYNKMIKTIIKSV